MSFSFISQPVAVHYLLSIHYSLAFQNSHNVGFFHDEVFLAVDFDFGTAIGREQYDVPDFDLDITAAAIVEQFAIPDAYYLAASGFLFGGVGQNDSAFGGGFRFHAFDKDFVREGFDFHFAHNNSLLLSILGIRTRFFVSIIKSYFQIDTRFVYFSSSAIFLT